MKKLNKIISIILLSTMALSLAACENKGGSESKEDVSGGSSATQSTASDKSGTSSKDESKADDTSSKDDSKPDEASDADYEKMMETVDKIKTAVSKDDFYVDGCKCFESVLGDADVTSLEGNFPFVEYHYGDYSLRITDFSNVLTVESIDLKSKETTKILDIEMRYKETTESNESSTND